MSHFILIVLLSMLPLACASPRSTIKVQNKAEGTKTTISQTTGDGGSISVHVTPDVTVKLDSTKKR